MGNTVKPSLLNHLIVFINEQQPDKGTFLQNIRIILIQ